MNIHSIAWKSILRLQQIYPQQVDEICTKIGLSKTLLSNENLTLPVEIFLNFFIEAESVFDDELISINYSRMAQIRPNYSELLGLIFVYSRNLNEGFKLLRNYINIELEGISLVITEEQDIVKIQSVADPRINNASLYENLCLSVLAAFVRSKRYQIKCLNTKLQPASKSSKEKSIFNCPIMFNSTDTSIAISRVTFQRKNTVSNPKLVAYLSKLAKERLQLAMPQRNIIDRVEMLLLNYENHYNKINIEEISVHLGMSVNSLRNQLAKSNANFRQIFNQFKLKRAKLILKEGCSVQVVAYLLGYSESSSFIRWFIGQTNISPSNYKNSVRN